MQKQFLYLHTFDCKNNRDDDTVADSPCYIIKTERLVIFIVHRVNLQHINYWFTRLTYVPLLLYLSKQVNCNQSYTLWHLWPSLVSFRTCGQVLL